MSWMQKLYEVYDARERQKKVGDPDETPMLLPLYHGTQQAQLEVAVDGDGHWLPDLARAISVKSEQETVIPCTEKSASRTSSPEPMPLFDKLIYLAGDYGSWFDEKRREPSPYALYVEALQAWCDSPERHPDAEAWLAYVRKGCLIRDLMDAGIFTRGEGGGVSPKWAGTGKPGDAFVRFRVCHAEESEDRVWMKPSVAEAFIRYQRSLPAETGVCYVLGTEQAVSGVSPKYIRYPGDSAKLVSANDSGGFTYRGRFDNAAEALVIGRETTEKAHAALKWLIRRQGYRNGEQVVLTFGTGGDALPSPAADTVALAGSLGELMPTLAVGTVVSLKESFARELSSAIRGYQDRLDPQAEAIVLGLNAATPGRLSIFYYREMRAEDFLNRIKRWHTTCAWLHTYRYVPDGMGEDGKPRYKRIRFIGAPAPADIIKAAYGEGVGEPLLKSGVERLLPCVVDQARLPADLVSSAARRAAQAAALEPAERDKALSIACALIRKAANDQKREEVWDMALQTEVRDRSYLFGRAWAYAEAIERYALQLSDERRDTNAERLMTAFARHPARSWAVLADRLRPYQSKLGPRANALNEGMLSVICALDIEGFTNAPLEETYLLGYACQKQAFADERDQKKAAKEAQKEE